MAENKQLSVYSRFRYKFNYCAQAAWERSKIKTALKKQTKKKHAATYHQESPNVTPVVRVPQVGNPWYNLFL